jgi:hypothetical protein
MDLVKGHGVATLYDLYYFGLNAEYRNQVISDRAADGSMAQLYFKQRFNKLDSEQQSHLISGLAAKLSRLATETLQSTFCPAYGDSDQVFEGFLETLADRPGILVFSVPEATYSQELARLLGVSFLRAFQTQMLRRTDSAYGAKGGNTRRLVLQVTDECWAYMNRGIASFTAVARQARVCNVFLSQSLDQLHDSYRDTIVGNFRTKALLGVNDELTLKTFSNLFGEMKETFTTESLSENLQDVRHGVYTERMKGRSQGVSRSQNTSERIVPRFSQTEIQHLPPGRMIVHLYDGQKQHDATAVETTPYFKLTYHLLHPLAHPDIRCKGASKAEEHTYRSDDSGGVVCTRCEHRLAHEACKELDQYRAVVRAA